MFLWQLFVVQDMKQLLTVKKQEAIRVLQRSMVVTGQ